MTPKEYAKLNNISYYKSLKYFKENGLPLEGSGGKNRKISSNPFINTTNVDNYWIGYIAADGNVSKNSNSISISSKDTYHLKKYVDYYCLNPLYYDKEGKAVAYFSNSSTKEFLVSLGITPNKSKTMLYKGIIDNHFLRGVFDGDGSASNGRPKITSGSINFIKQLEELFSSLEFSYKVYTKGSPPCFDIEIIGESKWRFVDWLYKDASVYLERKFQKLVAYREKSRLANRVNSGKAVMPILSQATEESVEGATTNGILLEQ